MEDAIFLQIWKEKSMEGPGKRCQDSSSVAKSSSPGSFVKNPKTFH